MKKIINKKDEEFFENVEYFSEIIDRINDIQTDNNYSNEEMDNDLDVALWRAFVYINLWSYKGYAKAEKILKKVENKGIKITEDALILAEFIKKIIQNNDISKNEIISKEHNKLKGTQFLTEDKVMKGYRKILSELN